MRRTGRPSAASPASAARSILPAMASAKDAIARGDVVLDPDLHAPTDRIDAHVAAAGDRAKVGRRSGCRCVCITPQPKSAPASCCSATKPIPPGGEALVQLVLDRPIAAAAGDRFVLRDTTAQRTIGGGIFLDLRAPARKRRTPERLAQLQAQCHRRSGAGARRAAGRCRRTTSIFRLSRATAR